MLPHNDGTIVVISEKKVSFLKLLCYVENEKTNKIAPFYIEKRVACERRV